MAVIVHKLTRAICHLNPSIVRWHGKLIMAYRFERLKPNFRTQIAICELGSDFQPTRKSKRLDLPAEQPDWQIFAAHGAQDDPRLLIWRDELWISYTDRSHQRLVRLTDDFQPQDCYKSTQMQTEKNWQFFLHNDQLYSVYTMNPYVIHRLSLDGQHIKIEETFTSPVDLGWDLGVPRGGSLPTLVGDRYCAFYHSSKPFKSNGKGRRKIYHMGYYEFEAKPPFRPLVITEKPVLSGDPDYHPRSFNLGHMVVFPMAAAWEDGRWLVSYGWNDRECRIDYFDPTTFKLKAC